jgi:alcohol dehydrogenase class IV
MGGFLFNTTPSIRFGWGVSADLVATFHLDSNTTLFLVTDQGIARTNLLNNVLAALKSERISTIVYDKVTADPAEHVVLQAATLARFSGVNAVVGFGGGSSLDVAKLVSLLVASDEKLPDIYGVSRVRGRRLPLALIPTTAGTGSEVTPIAVVTTASSEKRAVSSSVLLPDLALLDPELTVSLPSHITATTGIDAMVHAIEAYTSINPNANPISKGLAAQALPLLTGAIVTAFRDGSNQAARSDMLLGSMLAGQAFANSPVAAVHALAYPLGGRYHLAHGLTNALVLPHVLRLNLPVCETQYQDLATKAFPRLALRTPEQRAGAFIDELTVLSLKCGLPQRLRDVGIERSVIPALAADAIKQTRLLVNNPRPLQEVDIVSIYEAAW